MRHLKTLASALAIVMVILMATDYIAMAATGKPLILGKVNKSGKTTTVKSSNGAALSLKTRAGQPPLVVNQGTKVPNLNADRVDGKSASQLGVRTRTARFTFTENGVESLTHIISNVKAGTYLVNYSMFLEVSAAVTGYCYLSNNEGYAAFASSPSLQGTKFAASGTGVIRFSSTDNLFLNCFFSGPTNVTTSDTVSVSITAIDTSS